LLNEGRSTLFWFDAAVKPNLSESIILWRFQIDCEPDLDFFIRS
jgi:hypothetical protein